MQSVLDAFAKTVAAFHGNVALLGDGFSLTYGELDLLSDRIAGGLACAGVGQAQHVPVFLGRSPGFVAAILGIMKRGAVYVPVDPAYPRARQQAIVEQLDAAVGISSASSPSPLDGLRLLDFQSLCHSAPQTERVQVSSNDPLYIMFTSGSTGTPKGAVIPHRGVVRLVCAADYAEFGPDHRWALLSSVSFDASTLEIWGALLNGGTCVVAEDQLPSIDRIAEFFNHHSVTDTWLTAAMFNTAVEFQSEMFRGLRQVFTGGESESVRHFAEFLHACPGVRLIHGYGPTENTTFTLCHTVTSGDVERDGRVPIGRAIRGTNVRILDSERMPVSAGQVGELYAGGLGVGLGYVGQPALSQEKFVTLDDSGELWYRTGDVVFERPDGAIVFVRRVDRQIKLRGYRIELEEIEKVLLSFPGISAAVVDVAGDVSEERQLVAYCALASCAPVADQARVRAWLADRLPAYMIPTELHVASELPLTTSGKVDRRTVLAAATSTRAATS